MRLNCIGRTLRGVSTQKHSGVCFTLRFLYQMCARRWSPMMGMQLSNDTKNGAISISRNLHSTGPNDTRSDARCYIKVELDHLNLVATQCLSLCNLILAVPLTTFEWTALRCTLMLVSCITKPVRQLKSGSEHWNETLLHSRRRMLQKTFHCSFA